MDLLTAHIFLGYDYKGRFVPSASNGAEVFVPGLGVVKVAGCFSDELIERIKAEVVTALRIKLGHTIEVPKPIEPIEMKKII